MQVTISKTLLCAAGASVTLTLPASMAGTIIDITGPLTVTRGVNVYNNSNFTGVVLAAGNTVVIQTPSGGADGFLVIQENLTATGGVAWSALTDVPTDLEGFGLLEEVEELIATIPVGPEGPAGPPGEDGADGAPGSSDWEDITGKPTTLSGYGITDGLAPISVSFSGNGDAYFVSDRAYSLTTARVAGTGTLAYQKALAASPTSFSAVTLPFSLATGDVLKVTVSGISGYKAVTLT